MAELNYILNQEKVLFSHEVQILKGEGGGASGLILVVIREFGEEI